MVFEINDMKRLSILLMSMISLFSCNAQNGDKSMTRFEYGWSNGMVYQSGHSYDVSRLDHGLVRIVLDSQLPEERTIVTSYTTIFDELQSIVDKYRMKRYKGSYRPMFDIRDGDSWNFSLSYGEKVFSSSGYMAGPKNHGKAFGEIEDYFKFWRMIPGGEMIDAGQVAEFRRQWDDENTSALKTFRYEFHCFGSSSVNVLTDTPYIYYRDHGSNEGVAYCFDIPEFLEMAGKLVADNHLRSHEQTPLDKEDTSRDRWMVEATFDDGSKVEVVKYIEDERCTDIDNAVRRDVYEIFDGIKRRITELGEKVGTHSVTTYDADGRKLRTINYAGNGMVENGIDYNDPYKTF